MDEPQRDMTTNRADTRKLLSMRVDELDLPVRASNCLRREKITYVADLVQKTPEKLLSIVGMGRTSVQDIERALKAVGLRLDSPVMDVSTDDSAYGRAAKKLAEMSTHVDELELPVRASNCLHNTEIRSVGDLVRKTREDLLAIQNMGVTSVGDIERALARFGLRLGMSSAAVSAIQDADEDADNLQDLSAFIHSMELLRRSGVDHPAMITGMTSRQLLTVPGFGQGALAILEDGLSRWQLQLREERQDRREEPGRQGSDGGDAKEPPSQAAEVPSVQDHAHILSLEEATTFREELTQAVTRLLADTRGVSAECFVAYHGVDGKPRRTLREIGDAGSEHGFGRAVTRERVRQVLEQTEGKLRARARRVRFVHWALAEREASRNLPDSVHSFVSRFGYGSVSEPECVFKVLRLCAGIFELNFPFEVLKFSRVGSLVVDPADDTVQALVAGLPDSATGPYDELTEVANRVGCEQGILRQVIDVSPRWEFLDDGCRYFWKRPHLPPQKYSVTGNAILTSLCKVFSVAKRATISDLARSVARDRILRKGGPVPDIPIPVLRGIADRSGLFNVSDDHIARKKGLEWCVVGQRDIALIALCAEHGRVLPSNIVYSGLVRSGLTRENAAAIVAYSPFLVHTRAGVGPKEGVYKFVVRREDIDLDGLKAKTEEYEGVGVATDGEAAGPTAAGSVAETYVRIPVSSRTKLSGRFFAPEPLGLNGDWDVRDRAGVDIGQVTVAERTVSGLGAVITALRLEKGDVLEMRPVGAGTLVAS